MSEITKESSLEFLADYVTNQNINYVVGEFEREDNNETFVVVVAKESAHRALTEHSRLLQLENEQLAKDKAELVDIIAALIDCKGILTSDKECVIMAKEAIEKHKCDSQS